MKKIVIDAPGSYEHLKVQELPDLRITGDNDVLIDVASVGVNYADCLVRFGVYESAKRYMGFPITPGFEVSGKVTSIGSKVTRCKVGDLVVAFTFFNGYSTQLVLNESQIYHIPKNIDPIDAGGILATALTAYHALHQVVRIFPGSTILIHSAGGGVGSYLVQLAKLAGHKVVGVVGSSHKVDYVKGLGADHVIDRSMSRDSSFWAEEAQRFSPTGYDAIFDANGGESYKFSYELLKPTGKLLVYGAHTLLPNESGRIDYVKAIKGMLKTPRFKPMKMITENKAVAGFNLSFLFDRRDMMNEAMGDILNYFADGRLRVPKTTRFDFEDVVKAHQFLESGKSTGKIVLTVKA